MEENDLVSKLRERGRGLAFRWESVLLWDMRGRERALRPTADLIHRGDQWTKPEKPVKTLPRNIERRVFPDTQITAYRLAA